MKTSLVRLFFPRIVLGTLLYAAGLVYGQLFSVSVSASLIWAALLSILFLVYLYEQLRISGESLAHLRRLMKSARIENSHHLVWHANEPDIEGLARQTKKLMERFRTEVMQLTEQQRETEALLSSMTEGVLAVDEKEQIFRMNRAAQRMLDYHTPDYLGKHMEEVVRSSQLQRLIKEAFQAAGPQQSELTLIAPEEMVVQLYTTKLSDPHGQVLGVLVVLNDVTRMKQLETMRREFVANVSHELRTPITSIKGFVETLLDGAMHSPEDAIRFLEIIARQANRLNSIFDDLLSLSRIEHRSEVRDFQREDGKLSDTLHAAIRDYGEAAHARGVGIKAECPDDLEAHYHAALLEQAIGNLIDNAIKYSKAGSQITVHAREEAGNIEIDVIDQGSGIDPNHLPRLFERFYRADRSRSREKGGTGLGLAIVKHIAQAHQGSVRVASEVGSGSTFTIEFPRFANN